MSSPRPRLNATRATRMNVQGFLDEKGAAGRQRACTGRRGTVSCNVTSLYGFQWEVKKPCRADTKMGLRTPGRTDGCMDGAEPTAEEPNARSDVARRFPGPLLPSFARDTCNVIGDQGQRESRERDVFVELSTWRFLSKIRVCFRCFIQVFLYRVSLPRDSLVDT